jgi:hypothetical protein
VPKGDAKLWAGLGESEEGVAAIASGIGAGPPLILRRVTWQRMSFSEPLV